MDSVSNNDRHPQVTIKKLLLAVVAVAVAGCNPITRHPAQLASYLATQSRHPPIQARGRRPPPRTPAAKATASSTRLRQLARDLERNGNYQAAIEQYLQIVEIAPRDADTLHHLAVLHDKYGDTSQSARFYLRALQIAPENAELLCDYGYSRYIQGDLVQAESLLRRAVTLNPKLTRAYNNLGLTLAEIGRDQEALAAFAKTGLSRDQAQQNLQQAQVARRLSVPNRQAQR